MNGRTASRPSTYYIMGSQTGEKTIKKDQAFSDCVVLSRDTFDPDAVFLDDIVDDKVLPRLSLAVDGLTGTTIRARRRLEMRPDDAAAGESPPPSTTMPNVALDPEQLEVYGWETSFWRKFRGYLGF